MCPVGILRLERRGTLNDNKDFFLRPPSVRRSSSCSLICCWSCGFSPENLRDDVAESEESVVRTGVGVDRSILNELFRRKNVEVDLFIPGVPKTPNLSEDMPRTWFPRVPVGEERSTDFAEDASESPPSPPPLPHGDEAPSSAKDGLRRKVMRR